jgi:hypothetical protein
MDVDWWQVLVCPLRVSANTPFSCPSLLPTTTRKRLVAMNMAVHSLWCVFPLLPHQLKLSRATQFITHILCKSCRFCVSSRRLTKRDADVWSQNSNWDGLTIAQLVRDVQILLDNFASTKQHVTVSSPKCYIEPYVLTLRTLLVQVYSSHPPESVVRGCLARSAQIIADRWAARMSILF